MGDDGVGHALFADQRGQRARVDAGNADDAARLQPGVEMFGGAVVGRVGDVGLEHAAAHARRGRQVGRFDVFVIGADIADVREGEGDDLAGIGRVGEDFLIAGHGGVEAHFATALPVAPRPVPSMTVPSASTRRAVVGAVHQAAAGGNGTALT